MGTLDSIQIERLFTFVRKKYVPYLDVQHELVDHLATAIEEEMAADESLDFESALSMVYSRFPVTGFNEYIKEKSNALHMYWLKRLGRYMLTFLTIPRIIMTIMVLMICYYILINYAWANLALVGGVLISSFFAVFSIKKELGIKSMEQIQNKFLALNIYLSVSGVFGTLLGPMIIVFTDYKEIPTSTIQSVILSFVFTFVFLWTYAASTAFPKMFREELEQKYKHIDWKTVLS